MPCAALPGVDRKATKPFEMAADSSCNALRVVGIGRFCKVYTARFWANLHSLPGAACTGLHVSVAAWLRLAILGRAALIGCKPLHRRRLDCMRNIPARMVASWRRLTACSSFPLDGIANRPAIPGGGCIGCIGNKAPFLRGCVVNGSSKKPSQCRMNGARFNGCKANRPLVICSRHCMAALQGAASRAGAAIVCAAVNNAACARDARLNSCKPVHIRLTGKYQSIAAWNLQTVCALNSSAQCGVCPRASVDVHACPDAHRPIPSITRVIAQFNDAPVSGGGNVCGGLPKLCEC